MKFYKYTGAGNDFIIINSLEEPESLNLSKDDIKLLCDRHFGIGADGLMLLKKHKKYDFEMDYYNSDGSGGTMCGNGGRCIVAFAKKIGLTDGNVKFIASDGLHEAYLIDDNYVKLKMSDTENPQSFGKDFLCYTGSPHYIIFADNIDSINVKNKGQNVRYSKMFIKEGINVNFIEKTGQNNLKIRTYERGVESETLACGTGAVASALTYAEINNLKNGEIILTAPGGQLKVSFEKTKDGYENIWLSGPADYVFEGYTDLKLK